MDKLSRRFDNLGYDLLDLDNLIYLNLDTSPADSCISGYCDKGCNQGCATCKPGCSSGGK